MDFKFIFKQKRGVVFLIVFLFSIYSTCLYLTVGQRGYDDVLVILASQFLKWKVTLPVLGLPPRDIANYYNNYYVYFGPLSSLLLAPFVFIFGRSFPQVTLGIFSLFASFIATYFISKHHKFEKIDALWLSVFFVFSTVLFSSSVINITAYQVEALGVPFILFSLWAYFAKKNGVLIGLFLSLAVLTRFTLMLAVGFFLMEVLQKRLSIKHFVYILIPVVIALGVLGMYNVRRFHSASETGYNYSTTKEDLPIGANFTYGDKSIIHIPANLYSFLLLGPEPLKEKNDGLVLKFPYIKFSPWGVSILFTSPLFILLLIKFKKGKYALSAATAVILLSGPVFLWYSIGYAQVGYRYALDFLPFLFLLLLPCLTPKLSKTALTLITIGVFINMIYSDSVWELYPLFNILH